MRAKTSPEGEAAGLSLRWGDPTDPGDDIRDALEGVLSRLLCLLGEDPDRQGLRRTPERGARALRRFTEGYSRDAASILRGAIFDEGHEGLVLVRDIEFHSLCEHHLLPFSGRVHVAYLSDGRVVGLSKLARVVEVFARRLQVQERLTDQIADALQDGLGPTGVAVAVEATHLCMVMRGVEKSGSTTFTVATRGAFHDDPGRRREFLDLVRGAG